MSDSVKGAEVEDVLSSVRRLISNDHRRGRPMPEPERILPEPEEKLILTASLRVEDTQAHEARAHKTQADDTQSDDAPSYEEALAFDGASLEDRIAELEAAISERPEDWEPDGSEDESEHRPTQMVVSRRPGPVSRPLRLTRVSLIDAEAQTDADRDSSDEPKANDGLGAPPSGAPIANELGTVEAASTPEAEPTEVPQKPELEDSGASEEARAENAAPESAFVPAGAEDVAADVEPAIGHLDESVDEGGIEDADFVEIDDEELEADRMDRAPSSRTVDRMRELYGDEVEDAIMDSDALRGMVSAMIRDELQGELGERITRNVRKLVRREIQRALAARDLH